MSEPTEETIFWLDGFEGIAQGGYFVRNDLKDRIKNMRDAGYNVVGIKFDGTYNLELLVGGKKDDSKQGDGGSRKSTDEGQHG